MNIPDNYDQWESHERRLKQLEDKLPKCDRCHKPIRDEYCFNVYGETYCEECNNILFRVNVEV
jgi:hypothetical protein